MIIYKPKFINLNDNIQAKVHKDKANLERSLEGCVTEIRESVRYTSKAAGGAIPDLYPVLSKNLVNASTMAGDGRSPLHIGQGSDGAC